MNSIDSVYQPGFFVDSGSVSRPTQVFSIVLKTVIFLCDMKPRFDPFLPL